MTIFTKGDRQVKQIKKVILIGFLSLALPTISFSEEKQGKDFSFVDIKIKDCRGHFDIMPYLMLAIGVDQDDRITPETVKSLENFEETGRIALTDAQSKDPIAVICAIYAEGLLVGGIGSRLVRIFAEGLSKALDEPIDNVTVKVVEEKNDTNDTAKTK